MAEESIVPKPVMVLGDALRPISREMEKRMLEVPARTERQEDILKFVSRHLGRVGDDVVALTDELNGDLRNAIAAGDNSAAIWRATGRFEMCVERLLDSYDEVRRVKGDARDAPGLLLLSDIYRERLDQARAWLDEVLDFVDDPIATLRKRGLATEGDVDLTISLTLEASPQMDSLVRWGKQRAEELSRSGWDYPDGGEVETAKHGGRRRDYGVLALMLSAFGLGWLMGGDDE